MKRILYAVTILLAVSCAKEIDGPVTVIPGDQMTFAATAPGHQTKALIVDNTSVYWSAQDEINVFYGSLTGGKFTSDNTSPAVSAKFTGSFDAVSGGIDAGSSSDCFWAVYPYDEANSCDGNGIRLTIPAEQTAVSGSFDRRAFISMAVSENLSLAFYNVCGGVRFTVSHPNIKEIVFKGNNNEILAGGTEVGLDDDGLPAVKSLFDSKTEVTIVAPDGGCFVAGDSYYIVLCPVLLENGFTMTFVSDNGNREYVMNKAVRIKRSIFAKLDGKDGVTETISGAEEFIRWMGQADTYGPNDEFIIADDIDLEDVELPMVSEFKGTLDGNGKSIRNLTATSGLFNVLSGSVTDLTFTSSCKFTTSGPIFGTVANQSKGIIENCKNCASIEYVGSADAAALTIGGIVGVANEMVKNCINEGTITVNATSLKGTAVAGIAGITAAPVVSCDNHGVISVSAQYCAEKNNFTDNEVGINPVKIVPQVAGIVALARQGFSIEGCTNYAAINYTLTSVDSYKGTSGLNQTDVAGIVGSSSGDITNCHNKGAVTLIAKSSTGTVFNANEQLFRSAGISGSDYFANGSVAQNSSNITGCTNSATITVDMDVSTSNSCVAGIVGWPGVESAAQTVVTKDCENTGDIVAKGFGKIRAGGVQGGSGHMENCVNRGNISMSADVLNTSVAGSLCGFHSKGMKILNCKAFGSVKSATTLSGVGGLIGNIGNVAHTTAEGCVVDCEIVNGTEGDSTMTGLVVGYFNGTTKTINLGSVTPIKVKGTVNGIAITGYNYLAHLRGTKNYNGVVHTINAVFDGDMPEIGAVDLSADGTANCYIVGEYGPCKFDATKKGHTSESVGSISSATVLWESFGTDVEPLFGDVVNNVSVKNGIVSFIASGRDGNAVIAVKDAAGDILWSWHIWVCQGFDPAATAQEYNNNAGTVMDRNLGATSATKGDVKALGLLYQWGRKDPFLGGELISYSSLDNQAKAKSTITWPFIEPSNSSNGTIDYVVKHPTTFVKYNSSNYDWYYTGGSSTDNTRWYSSKGMYDPCPKGWKVPDGDSNGLWAKAFGTSSSWQTSSNWDLTNRGMDFGSTDKKLGSGEIWYPASGYLNSYDGALYSVGNDGFYWSCTPNGNNAYDLSFGSHCIVVPSYHAHRASGRSVRCVKESTPDPELEAKDLSADGTANCYIVNEYGPCKFDATKKGNSDESVGDIASAEVLWESFGDDVQPAVGDIVSNVSVKNGIVSFTASGKDGNAVIAVKDANGTILWSWHIWVCKDFDPAATAQVYYNNAGTVMDRNLGATSATKGDVKALGLLYQWGRKDPFLSGQSISNSSSSNQTKAKSTITWPSTVSSNSSNGTIDFVVKHPTTFVTYNSNNGDWYYTGSSSTDNTRWNSSKGMYDPCPKGWKVPDGDSNGLWAKAFGTSSWWTTSSNWDSTNKGMDFGSTDKKLGSGEIWYPASGYLYFRDGTLYVVGYFGYYWSCTPDGYGAYCLNFGYNGRVSPSSNGYRAIGHSVRCLQE